MDELLKWIIEIQSIAQIGIAYTKDPFDKERYERLREISKEMISKKSNLSLEQVDNLFCNEKGYQTPKIDTRAAIFENDKILLVKENNGKWSLPGGWCDVLETISSNIKKEVKEETGLSVKPISIISLQDRNKHNTPVYAYGICKIFILCEKISGNFIKNIETLDAKYFTFEEISLLDEAKTTKEQIKMCFDANNNQNFKTQFD